MGGGSISSDCMHGDIIDGVNRQVDDVWTEMRRWGMVHVYVMREETVDDSYLDFSSFFSDMLMFVLVFFMDSRKVLLIGSK